MTLEAKALLVALTVLLFFNGYPQNLVPNPSFEDTIKCPENVGEIASCYLWHSVNSVDYYSSCSENSMIGVPKNFAGQQMPRTGNSYIGMVSLFEPVGYVELIWIGLSQILVKGETYRLTFYSSLSDRSLQKVSTISAGFYEERELREIVIADILGSKLKKDHFFQVPFDTVNVDTSGWTKMEYDYKAKGGESILIIGNCKKCLTKSQIRDSRKNKMHEKFGSNVTPYYYIDDISLINTKSTTFHNTLISQDNSAVLNNTNNSELLTTQDLKEQIGFYVRKNQFEKALEYSGSLMTKVLSAEIIGFHGVINELNNDTWHSDEHYKRALSILEQTSQNTSDLNGQILKVFLKMLLKNETAIEELKKLKKEYPENSRIKELKNIKKREDLLNYLNEKGQF